MKVSIITASYNSSKTIKETLNCIKNQSYSNIEHIIIDGKSNDSTLDIVNTFPHISKVISEPDKGIYDAMNKGITQATGDIIGILNSDDFYTHDRVLENIVRAIKKNKSDAIYADLQYVHQTDISKTTRKWKAGKFKKSKFLNGWMPPHPTFFVKSHVYEKLGNFALSLKSAADYEIMLRFLYCNDISVCYLPETIVSMRTGGQSNLSLKNRILANKEDKLAWYMNNIRPPFYTTWLKPLRKVPQFLNL